MVDALCAQRAVGRDFVGPTNLYEEFGQLALGESLGPKDRARDVPAPTVALAARVASDLVFLWAPPEGFEPSHTV